MKMTATQVSLPEDLYKQVRRLARKEGRAYSNFVRRLLEERIADSQVPEINRAFEDARQVDIANNLVE